MRDDGCTQVQDKHKGSNKTGSNTRVLWHTGWLIVYLFCSSSVVVVVVIDDATQGSRRKTMPPDKGDSILLGSSSIYSTNINS